MLEFLHGDVFLFGFAPVIAYITGYLCTAVPLEILIRASSSVCDKYGVTHTKSDGTRSEALSRTQEKVPWAQQLRTVVNVLFGPTAIVNGIFGYFLLSRLCSPDKKEIPALFVGLTQFVSMSFVGDFFLYWGHRIQHEIPFLWEHCHKLHHTLDAPSPLGTLYINHIDATLQGALPMLLATVICQPNLVVMYIYIFLRIAENVMNHTGLSWPLLDIIFLKVLPFRASVAHHDAHHKFSNYGAKEKSWANAKNYAEMFWIWDYLFGTLRGQIFHAK